MPFEFISILSNLSPLLEGILPSSGTMLSKLESLLRGPLCERDNTHTLFGKKKKKKGSRES